MSSRVFLEELKTDREPLVIEKPKNKVLRGSVIRLKNKIRRSQNKKPLKKEVVNISDSISSNGRNQEEEHEGKREEESIKLL